MKKHEINIVPASLSERYPIAFAQEITDQLSRLDRRDVQLLDIKELNDLAAEYRTRIRGVIAHYRAGRAAVNVSVARQVYASHENVFVQRQISDLWKVYRILMADSHELTATYMAQLRQRKFTVSRPTGKEYRAAA